MVKKKKKESLLLFIIELILLVKYEEEQQRRWQQHRGSSGWFTSRCHRNTRGRFLGLRRRRCARAMSGLGIPSTSLTAPTYIHIVCAVTGYCLLRLLAARLFLWHTLAPAGRRSGISRT